LFIDHERHFWLSSRRIDTLNTRGTGCTLASAIASALALGYSLYDSVVIGKMAINQALRLGYGIETDQGPVAMQSFPDRQIDLPCLTKQADFPLELYDFPPCNEPKLGLYPVVDRASWIPRLADQGVTTIQLRVKDLTGAQLENEIKSAIQLAQQYHCRLFINDYWQLAIQYQAYGVHLGQEDLDSADISAIHKAGLRLGISTHCHYEVARAHSYKPSYIACGPIYHTETKVMPWVPQGIAGLSYWRKVLNYPLVAIGGINRERLTEVAQTHVDGIAMITAITLAKHPEQTTKEFIQFLDNV
jgi:hydroxymethylpyrimidine kinase/phosphomethylpyrimidine kinase/thiamine-phosphate diphosphorylase